MHIEFLVEDSSGKCLLEILVAKVLAQQGDQHSWRIIGYKGVGRLPRDLAGNPNPKNKALLNNLPRLVKGYGNTPGIDAIVFVLDSDRAECRILLQEILNAIDKCEPKPQNTLVRLAIEEIEAWYFGDRDALLTAYPKGKVNNLNEYLQDSICDTWERLADAIYPGGMNAIKKHNINPGDLKHEWARTIGPLMDVDANTSPSFNKFRTGLIRLISPC
jgi:Domain of unknown function (DUF4276)